jgi:hypothetical protein
MASPRSKRTGKPRLAAPRRAVSTMTALASGLHVAQEQFLRAGRPMRRGSRPSRRSDRPTEQQPLRGRAPAVHPAPNWQHGSTAARRASSTTWPSTREGVRRDRWGRWGSPIAAPLIRDNHWLGESHQVVQEAPGRRRPGRGAAGRPRHRPNRGSCRTLPSTAASQPPCGGAPCRRNHGCFSTVRPPLAATSTSKHWDAAISPMAVGAEPGYARLSRVTDSHAQ